MLFEKPADRRNQAASGRDLFGVDLWAHMCKKRPVFFMLFVRFALVRSIPTRYCFLVRLVRGRRSSLSSRIASICTNASSKLPGMEFDSSSGIASTPPTAFSETGVDDPTGTLSDAGGFASPALGFKSEPFASDEADITAPLPLKSSEPSSGGIPVVAITVHASARRCAVHI